MHTVSDVNHGRRIQAPPPPPPPPPPREKVDPAVRAPALHKGQKDAPPPEHYVQHEVQRGETLTEVSHRYQTTVPMIQAANPQIKDADQIEIGQKVNVPIGVGYGKEPTADVVEPGQSLTDMAKAHPGVSPYDIANANRHQVPNANLIYPGQKLWVPADKPATPLEQKVRATDQALATYKGAERTYDGLTDSAPSPARLRVYDDMVTAKADLKTAVNAELEQRLRDKLPAGQDPSEKDYDAAGKELAARYTSDKGDSARLNEALKSLAGDREQARVQKQADDIVAKAKQESDPGKAVQSLNDQLKTSSPQVRKAALASQGAQDVVQKASDWAMEPLDPNQAKGRYPGYMMGERMEGQRAAERLDQVTKGLDPELAAQVVDKSLPKLEQYAKVYQDTYKTPVIGEKEMGTTLKVLERSLDTPTGKANMDRMLKMGMWNAPAVTQHIAEGGRPDYAIAFGQQPKKEGLYGDYAAISKHVIETGTTQFREKVTEDARAYAGHMEEIGWLIQNQGGTMTPDQLKKAIADYTTNKLKDDPNWEADGKRMQQTLADDGKKLLAQMASLGQGANNGATSDASVEALKKTLDDPASRAAVSTALQADPNLASGPMGQRVLDFLVNPNLSGPAKLANRSVWLGQEFANAYVKSNVLGQLQGLDRNDPASIQKAKDALASMRDSRFAKLMGVSPEQMNKAVDAIENGALPKLGDDTQSLVKRLHTVDQELGELKGFEKSTVPGQMLRAVGVGLAGVGLMASGAKAIDDPTLANNLRVLSDAAGLVWRGAEIGVGTGVLKAESKLGWLGGSTFSKITGVMGATVDAIAAYDAFSKGDNVSGGLYVAQGTGMMMATFGASAASGLEAAGVAGAAALGGPIVWVGVGIMAVAAVGMWAWNDHKANSQHEPDFDKGRSLAFLKQAGIDDDAARTLCDQSGGGYSAVPLLVKYAQTQGLNLQNGADQAKFKDWINHMDPAKLTQLKDWLHATATRLEGDVGKFGATAGDDASYQPSVTRYYPYPYSSPTGNVTSHPAPVSAVQLEKVLGELGVPAL